MKKSIRVEDLDCANCAAKLEKAISGIEGVKSVTVSFMAQKILLEADEDQMDSVLSQLKKAAKKTLPDCTLIL